VSDQRHAACAGEPGGYVSARERERHSAQRCDERLAASRRRHISSRARSGCSGSASARVSCPGPWRWRARRRRARVSSSAAVCRRAQRIGEARWPAQMGETDRIRAVQGGMNA
jgi:hypothetical protein